MIKKSVFENEIVAAMHAELIKKASSQNTDNLEKAVDYLNSAIDIFEDAGLSSHASKVFHIIAQIAHKSNVMKMPSMKALVEKGMRIDDIKEFTSNPIAKARVNRAFRALGYSDEDMAKFMGASNIMPVEDVDMLLDENRAFMKIWDWMKDPKKVDPGEQINPGDEFEIKSIASNKNLKNRKSKKTDKHTKGLTSKKMLSNLKNHGTVFNLADDHMVDDLTVSEYDLEDFEDEK